MQAGHVNPIFQFHLVRLKEVTTDKLLKFFRYFNSI